MSIERERKFRVTRYDPTRLGTGEKLVQGYLCFSPEVRVRVRGTRAFLTIKGEGTVERQEFEYAIPLEDALRILPMAEGLVTKTRYLVGGLEVDVFEGDLAGLVVAEAEVARVGVCVHAPEWMEWEEVTGDPRYLNANLARKGIPDP